MLPKFPGSYVWFRDGTTTGSAGVVGETVNPPLGPVFPGGTDGRVTEDESLRTTEDGYARITEDQ